MKLKKVFSNIIPFEGYLALTVWPWCFIRKDCKDKFDDVAERHETTHAYQQLEMYAAGATLAAVLAVWGCSWWSLLAVPLFFWWYLIEWLVKAVLCFFANRDAYYSISFEQEAYEHEEEVYYNDVRKFFNWIKYVFKLKSKPRLWQ